MSVLKIIRSVDDDAANKPYHINIYDFIMFLLQVFLIVSATLMTILNLQYQNCT
jgi:hypothetical protein